MRTSRTAIACALAAVACAATCSRADGPLRWNRLLIQGDRAILDAPRGNIELEFNRLPKVATTERYPNAPQDETAIESRLVADARAFGCSWATNHDWIDANWLAAMQLSAAMQAHEAIPNEEPLLFGIEVRNLWGGTRTITLPHTGPLAPEGTPAAEALLRSAMQAYRDGELEQSWRTLRSLLSLPPKQRQSQTLEAEYLLGRIATKWVPLNDRLDPATQYAKVHDLACKFDDPHGIGCAALGQQGRLALDAGEYLAAVRLYLEHKSAGDPTADMSLVIVARTIIGKLNHLKDVPPDLARAIADENVAHVITAYIVSYVETDQGARTSDRVGAFLSILAAQGRERYARFADRLAMAAYESGDVQETAAWLAVAPKNSAMAMRLQAKLLARAGRIDAAGDELARAIAAFGPSEIHIATDDEPQEGAPWYANTRPDEQTKGELAVIRLGQQRYAEAVGLFLDSGRYLDACYVAERVMTSEELASFVDHRPDVELMRNLLGARLMRAGDFARAAKYFNDGVRGDAQGYAAALAIGQDLHQPAEARAVAMMSAARLARWSGERLLATMLEPDWNALDLNSQLEPAVLWRVEPPVPWRIAVASADEQSRVRASATAGQRWHYRSVAQDHAWTACALLPDSDPRLPGWLVEAGRFNSAKDPAGSNRFYKALIQRCPNSPEGIAARKSHWFPATQPSGPTPTTQR
jgi:tetratricopeptide (TPR) repeat protein